MNKKTTISILLMLAVIASCSQPNGEKNAEYQLDTLKAVVRTDTGVFIKVTYTVNGRETTEELRKGRGVDDTEPFIMYAYGYDTLGNKNLIITSAYNRTKKDFVHVSKEEQVFDEYHNPTLSTLYTEKRGVWYPDKRYGRTFDARGNVTALETYDPEKDDKWVIKTKTYFQYDNANNITEKTDFRTDEKGVWHPVEKVQREFSKSQVTMEIISAPTRDDQWVEKSKAEYEYNAGHQCSASMSFIKRGNKWLNYVRSEYTYDATGNMLECNTFFWNEKKARWVFHDKEEY